MTTIAKKAGAQPKLADDTNSLKTLAMPELMKRLNASTDGLTQAEAAKRLAQNGPQPARGKEDQ